MHLGPDEEEEDRHARTILNNKSAATVDPASLGNHFAEICVLVSVIVFTCCINSKNSLLSYSHLASVSQVTQGNAGRRETV